MTREKVLAIAAATPIEWLTNCQPWAHTKPDANGYAHVRIGDEERSMPVTRVILEAKLGRPLAPGMFALHTCDFPQCIAADHLYEGTSQQNARDASARGRCRNQYSVRTLGRVR